MEISLKGSGELLEGMFHGCGHAFHSLDGDIVAFLGWVVKDMQETAQSTTSLFKTSSAKTFFVKPLAFLGRI
jgi:hypothetical protein